MNKMIESPICPRIAIIGTEGSGKTVLITMLAKRFSQANESGLFLNPLDAATLRFVERNYHILATGDWPPSSPVGQLFNLHWRLEKGGSPEWFCEIRLADSAGQDLRRVFGDDQPLEFLPTQLKELAEYSRQADIVICLVNLKDFRGEQDETRRTDNEAVIKSALDYLISDTTRQRHLCLLFTQADQFRLIAEKCGGWGNIAKKYLPYIHGAHVLNGRVSVAAVAAVADTKVTEIDGQPRRVPAHGFRSDGLNSVMQWVSGKAHDVFANRLAEIRQAEEAYQAQEQLRIQRAAEQSRQRARQASKRTMTWGGAVLGAILFLFATRPPAPKELTLVVPSPEMQGYVEYGWRSDDFKLANKWSHCIYDVNADVDLRSNPKNGKLYQFHWPRIAAGEEAASPEFDVKNDGTQPQYRVTGKWFQATVGISYGRFANEWWIRNDSPIPANNVVVDVTVTSSDGKSRTVSLSAPHLNAYETFSWGDAIPVSSSDNVQCLLQAFDDI